ncbi:MAG: tRNA dihydrouridine synthase DusB [Gemmobacter sp.]|uniref:tRNA dihydrouridine synthase DusB n=1 Tax=Gemmobacter sp. TaxID=1898957 RepID=UPI00391C5F78
MTIALADASLDPPVFLAPLAGITDLPFRRIVAGFGAGLVVSEMIASQEVVQGRPLARAKAELGFGESATSVQLAGRDPWWLAEAARWCEGQGARIIDINMGCPAKKVTSASGNGACGSALMREPDLALRLIEAVVQAVQVPVTVKMRLGWDDASHNAAQIAARAEAAGVRMVVVHGRTRCQFYTGQADWAAIAPVVQAVRIPVIANGDITDAATARAALAASGAAGVMIGRGAQGRPWRLAQVAAELWGAPTPQVPQGAALADLVVAHHDSMLAFYGTDLGLRVARKHLGWYLDEARAAAADRARILTMTDAATVRRSLRSVLADAPGPLQERRAA